MTPIDIDTVHEVTEMRATLESLALHHALPRFLYATWQHLAWQPRSDREHRAILRAVKRGDEAQARILLEAHIRDAGAALCRQTSSCECRP